MQSLHVALGSTVIGGRRCKLPTTCCHHLHKKEDKIKYRTFTDRQDPKLLEYNLSHTKVFQLKDPLSFEDDRDPSSSHQIKILSLNNKKSHHGQEYTR